MNLDGTPESTAALARLAAANHHSSLLSDESQRNYFDALRLARDIEAEGCPSCRVLVDVVPMVHTAWAVEQLHESHCALYGDDSA